MGDMPWQGKLSISIYYKTSKLFKCLAVIRFDECFAIVQMTNKLHTSIPFAIRRMAVTRLYVMCVICKKKINKVLGCRKDKYSF